jgi:hypothetical protein
MPSLKLEPLNPEKIARAYALVQLVASDVSLAAWLKFAHQRISGINPLLGGIHTAQDRRGNILGLASYVAADDLNDVRTLTVDHLVVVATTGRQEDAVLSALLNALETIAVNCGCGAIQFKLAASGSAILDQHARWLLETAGHSERYVLLAKALAARG